LTEFKQAKLRVQYNPLKEAVCARIRRDRPEWSEYDLEAVYDRLYEGDAEINAMIVSLCGPSRQEQKPSLTDID
jgi:hypothetical protein